MYKTVLTGMVISMATISSPFQAHADFITNGSFEEPAADPETADNVGYNSGAGGWLASTTNTQIIDNTSRFQVSATGAIGLPAAAPDTGDTYTALISRTSHVLVGIKRATETLEIGETYTIAGYVSGSAGHFESGLDWEVRIGSTVLGSGDLTTSWQQFSFDYVANATDGTNPELKLLFNGGTGGQQRGVLWDEVSVVVPEPGSLGLLMLSTGLLAIRRRRRQG